ncbi:MAG: acyltransferase family protein [Bacteroidales bacterium]
MALLLLLWHHLFYDRTMPYNDYFNLGGILALGKVAVVCIALFVFLSGFGLSQSIKNKNVSIKKFYLRHLSKIYINYWLIWLIFVPIGVFVFGLTFDRVYGEYPIGKAFLTFIGLQYNFLEFGYNVTWWFITTIISLYLLFPLLNRLLKKWGLWFVCLCLIFGFIHIPSVCHVNLLLPIQQWLAVFVLGMLCSKTMAIQFIPNHRSHYFYYMVIVVLIIVFWRQLVGVVTGHKADFLLAPAIIILIYMAIPVNSVIGKALAVVGRYSMDIFLFHTFIYCYWFTDIIYYTKDPIISFVTLFVICMTIAFMLDKFKKFIKVDAILKKIDSIEFKNSKKMV